MSAVDLSASSAGDLNVLAIAQAKPASSRAIAVVTTVGDFPARASLIAPTQPLLCRFLDAGGTKPLGTLGEPASQKRRGTKSRGVWGRVGSQRYGDLISAPIMTVGAKLAPGGLDRVRKGSWKRALGFRWRRGTYRPAGGSLIGVVLPRGIAAGVEPVQRNGKWRFEAGPAS